MTNEVQITGGSVILKSFVDRKTDREYNCAMYEGVEATAKDLKIPMTNLEKANDFLVLGMIETMILNEVKQTVSRDLLDTIDRDDFNNIVQACTDIVQGEKKKEKKSEKKQSNISKEVKA